MYWRDEGSQNQSAAYDCDLNMIDLPRGLKGEGEGKAVKLLVKS